MFKQSIGDKNSNADAGDKSTNGSFISCLVHVVHVSFMVTNVLRHRVA
jgi:hypothetical protein